MAAASEETPLLARKPDAEAKRGCSVQGFASVRRSYSRKNLANAWRKISIL